MHVDDGVNREFTSEIFIDGVRMVPSIILYIVLQEQIMSGIAAGAINE